MWDPVSDPDSYVESRYLVSKVTVDDRALNRQVLDVLRDELRGLSSPRVLEVGCGIGTMLTRLVDGGILRDGEYLALDADTRLLADLEIWLKQWAEGTGRALERLDASMEIRSTDGDSITVRPIPAELSHFAKAGARNEPVDLLIAHAVLDLVDVPAILPALFEQLRSGGLFWFSVNFDGDTIFQPDHPLDDALMAAYHRTMDERVRFGANAGESRSGRHLFGHLERAGARILAAGASDWVVFAQGGRYPAGEAYFLRHILRTIEDALSVRREVDQTGLQGWLTTRRAQIDSGELTYIGHQLDFVGRRRG